MEVINNRNELLINANDNFNLMLDVIINELQKEYTNLIASNNKEIKKQLEILINSIVNNANINQANINAEIESINNQLKNTNNELNNMSIINLIRNRKHFNINVDTSNLKDVSSNLIITDDLNYKNAIDNIIAIQNINSFKPTFIKDIAKDKINFKDLYIKLD